MRVIYADDEPGTLTEVCDFLQENRHEARPISTTNILDFQEKIIHTLRGGFSPDIIIIGGHNVMRNSEGQELFELEAFVITNWLEKARLSKDCNFVLYSRDNQLIEKVRQHNRWGFAAAVLKGQEDSLDRLLEALETIRSASV